jgi:hypothetical protein
VKKMDPDRRTAKIVGVLFIMATVASILGSVALGSVLDGSDYSRPSPTKRVKSSRLRCSS